MATAVFEINGQTVIVNDVDPHCTLLEWLRASGRTGAKEGCAEGECGACAVAWVGRNSRGQPCYETVNSCLVSLADTHGRSVISVEGLAGPRAALHPVQQALVDAGGSQCGYCTPGFVMSSFSEYYRPGRAGYDPEAISGNLCRCTGYRPIVSAARSLPLPAPSDAWLERLGQSPVSLPAIDVKAERGFARPDSLARLFELLERHPEAVLLGGGTDLMVDVNQRQKRYPMLVSLGAVRELQRFESTSAELVLGAGLSLSRLAEHLEAESPVSEPAATERAAHAVPLLGDLLPLFSSRLIRNRATLGGNVATASPIGDAAPALLALDAQLTLASPSGARRLELEAFFSGYRKTALGSAEVIVSVHLPLPLPRIQRFYKVSKRTLDDISTVAAAFALDLDEGGRVARLRVGYGGIAATPLRARALEQIAKGRAWDGATLEALCEAASTLGTPLSDQRGSAEYRRSMVRALLERFYFETARAAEIGQ